MNKWQKRLVFFKNLMITPYAPPHLCTIDADGRQALTTLSSMMTQKLMQTAVPVVAT